MCESTCIARDEFVKTISLMIKKDVFPHLHFCGPHENDVQSVVQDIVSPHYENRSMLLEIHILDNHSESLLVQTIKSFCNQQAVVADENKKPKVVIIHQHNEILTESFVHFLEDRMVDQRVKFIFLTTSTHTTPPVLLNKMVSFIIHPQNFSERVGGVDREDDFYNIINKKEIKQDDETLYEKILEWSELHTIRIPPIFYDKWRDILVN
tara:strand:+ start:2512 stop:3138 length:627 start_codon:yes stop_codon:yes gene_type:complete